MAAPNTTVKYFHSDMSGAPVLSGSAGALIAVLDACLVNGFGSITLDSLVVAGGIATATRSAGQLFEKDAVVLVAGATPAGLNGQKRTLSISGTQFTFDATGISDQTATGTVTVKLAPAGWGKQYSGTNLAAYRSLDVASNMTVLRVDDTGTTSAKVVGYESMADINSGTNPYPSAAQLATGAFWDKSDTANATARKWMVFADSRFFYFCPGTYNPSPNLYAQFTFGEAQSFKPADAYAGIILGGTTSNSSTAQPGGTPGNAFYSLNSAGWLQKDAAGLSASLACCLRLPGSTAFNAQSGATLFPPYPGTVHGSLFGMAIVVGEGNTISSDYRHTIPGAVFLGTSFAAGVLPSRAKLTAEGALAGRVLYFGEFGGGNRFAVDIYGPWR